MSGPINPLAVSGFLSPMEAAAPALGPSTVRAPHAHPPAHLAAGANQMSRPKSALAQRDARGRNESLRSKLPAQERDTSDDAQALPEDFEDPDDPGRRRNEGRVEPDAAARADTPTLDRHALESARAKTLERLADVAGAHAKAKQVGADIAAKGAYRTLLKKCLGVALAVVAVGLLAAATAGTGLIVVAAVKAALCVGDAVYARRVWKHHQAVASGNAQLMARHPLPKMGASLIGNLVYDFAKACKAGDEGADRFASVMQVLVAAGLIVAGFGCAGLPTELLPKPEDVQEIADKVNDGLKILLYGEQALGAAVHTHHKSHQDGLHVLKDKLRELQVHLDNEFPVPMGLPADRRDQLARALGLADGAPAPDPANLNDNDLRTRLQDMEQTSRLPGAWELANFSRGTLQDVLDLLDRAEAHAHEHGSHLAAGFAYFLTGAAYGTAAVT